MKVAEAKALVLDGITRDVRMSGLPIQVDPRSPDPSDPGKFVLAGKPARAIHHFDGWHLPIDLGWFTGGMERPRIQRGEFHWYVFAIPTLGRLQRPHYLICDHLQVREWVIEFTAPLGRDHRDHKDWRADIQVDRGLSGETQAYFRWGDEPPGLWIRDSRVVRLDNASVAANSSQIAQLGLHVGNTGAGGESEAHRRLKLYVAHHPTLLSLNSTAECEIEHRFITGDVVDVLFRNHGPLRTVAEIELAGTENIIIGIHQALKYRSLAAAEGGLNAYDVADPRAHVISFEDGGGEAHRLAAAYNVNLVTVDRSAVLAPTA